MSEADGMQADRWRAIAQSKDFQDLVSERRRTTAVLMTVSLGWFAVFLLLATFAQDFMGGAVFAEELTVAYVIGLSQFVLTFVVIRIYARKADGRFAQLERQIAEQSPGDAPAAKTPPRMGPR